MTSEEQAREIAHEYLDSTADVQFEGLVSRIVSALRTREAETWAQAAQEADTRAQEHKAKFDKGLGRLYEVLESESQYLAAVLRARAAQPQEETT